MRVTEDPTNPKDAKKKIFFLIAHQCSVCTLCKSCKDFLGSQRPGSQADMGKLFLQETAKVISEVQQSSLKPPGTGCADVLWY